MAVNYGSLPFLEAIAFFKAKLNLPTARWDDLLGAAHDLAFVVAGAMMADLLDDLRGAVDKAIEQGTTYETFKKDFEKIVKDRGWTGWFGEDTKEGRAWRARVIYETNLFTSYSAGRYRQMKEVANIRPYWRYRHSPASVDAREEHVAWDGLILKHDDPWWSTHSPSSGFGCKCYVETLAERDMKKQGLAVTPKDKIPYYGVIDPKTGLPQGIDKGWDYQPGANADKELATFITQKKTNWPPELSNAFDQLMKEKDSPIQNWRDAMNDPEWQAHLEGYKGGAGWIEEGGKIVLDEDGKFLERTKWLPIHQWYADYVSANQSGRILPSKMDKVIAKAQAGGKLGKAEDRLLQWLYEYTMEQKELNKADAADIAAMEDMKNQQILSNPQRWLDGMKRGFIEQVGDAGHEILSELSKEFYANNPGASIKDHNLHLISELKYFMDSA